MSRTFWLGLFIVFGLLILAAGVFIIGANDVRFQSTYPVKASFHNVAGLSEGAEVRVGGIHEGTVKRIDLPGRPDQDVIVTVNLARATRDVVKKDSVASIRSEGLLGDKYLEVSFGSSDAATLKGGETIASEPPLDISDLFKKTNEILDTAKDATQDIRGTASNLDAVSAKINQGQGTAGALVNDKTAYTKVVAGATAFQEDMEALKHNFLLRGFFNRRGYTDSTELTRHEIRALPSEAPQKAFWYDAGKMFDKPDTAKLKSPKSLNDAGRFLEQNAFGYAVVAASTGPKGDSEKARVLSQARAAVVRDYLAGNFRLDDTRIKTAGLGKSAGAYDEDGKVQILVYPPGTSGAAGQTAQSR